MAKEIFNELVFIQAHLKAPKNQRNTFSNYNYRSCEDIMEALKPLLNETCCTLVISDDIVQVANRIYVKATATLETPSGKVYSNSAFARETDSKKGMDESQVTGSASSYARKYALNGLFCIDDNKDPDSMNNTNNTVIKKGQGSLKKEDSKEQEALHEAFLMIKPNIETANSVQYLQDLHAQNVALHNYSEYKTAMNKRYKEISK